MLVDNLLDIAIFGHPLRESLMNMVSKVALGIASTLGAAGCGPDIKPQPENSDRNLEVDPIPCTKYPCG